MQDIEEILGPQGPLARHLPGFKPRKAQIRMVEAVAAALVERRPLLVEAGTGTGKTFAYLLPALLAGVRVLISTATRTLQDQLYAKDVPLLAGAIGLPAEVALLKGRANYLCLERYERLVSRQLFEGAASGFDAQVRARLRDWAATTASGDLAEVDGLTDAHPLWPQLTSTRENCLGQKCSRFAECHVVAARREAQAADVVIVNHHLLLADLALKEDGFGDLLGTADAVILDEAHALPDLATQFFGQQFGSRQVETLLNESRAAVRRVGFSISELGTAVAAVTAALQAAFQAAGQATGRATGEGELGEAFESAALALGAQLREYAEALQALPTESALDAFATRAVGLADALERIVLASGDEGAKTLERGTHSFSLRLLPFDISARFLAMMEARPAAWIFTSATLTVGENFAHFAGRLGLLDAQSLSIPSPFDYPNQALLYLPPAMPEPMSEGYVAAVIEASIPLLEASGGGAFILFTSHRALSQGAAFLRACWDGAALHPILVQGEGPREKLLREFREQGNAVLLGTASFWEGVDVKGDALRLVIIEKLPFASPDDPLTRARIDHLRRRGGNPFKEYQLPEAVLALKQGVGRLIRSETDRGVIALCDPRLTSKSYGRVFVASLPEMPVTRELAEARRFLARIENAGLTSAPVRGKVPSS